MHQHSVPRRVEWGETDAAGIVFYPNIYRWFDAAAHECLKAAGVDVSLAASSTQIFPLVETGARFLRPILYRDDIVIETRVMELRSRAFRLSHTVKRGPETLAEGYEVRVWARMVPGGIEAVAIPAEARRALGGQAE
jgi:acyl-CoA thioester hydrolase